MLQLHPKKTYLNKKEAFQGPLEKFYIENQLINKRKGSSYSG